MLKSVTVSNVTSRCECDSSRFLSIREGSKRQCVRELWWSHVYAGWDTGSVGSSTAFKVTAGIWACPVKCWCHSGEIQI